MEEIKVVSIEPNIGCLLILPRESGPDAVRNGAISGP